MGLPEFVFRCCPWGICLTYDCDCVRSRSPSMNEVSLHSIYEWNLMNKLCLMYEAESCLYQLLGDHCIRSHWRSNYETLFQFPEILD